MQLSEVTKDKKEKIKAQKRAYDLKRAALPHFPKQRLDDECNAKINDLLKIFETKKALFFEAIDELHKKYYK
jgi:hypothetical protein